MATSKDFLDDLTDTADAAKILGQDVVLRVPPLSEIAALRDILPKSADDDAAETRSDRYMQQYLFFGSCVAACVVPSTLIRARQGDQWARVLIATANDPDSGMADLLDKCLTLCDFPNMKRLGETDDDSDADKPADEETKNRVEKAAEGLGDVPSS